MYSIGWFSTGRDEAARDLLTTIYRSIDRGEIKAKISFVFSNREPGENKESDLLFKLIGDYRIPLINLSSEKIRASKGVTGLTGHEGSSLWRSEYDREVMRQLQGYAPQLCVLAGYMLIVGEEMCHRYNMINLHPAAPGGPTGTWQEVIWKLIKSKAEETGVMMHLVTPELDKGPAVTYATFPIQGKPFDKCWQELEGHSFDDIKKGQGEYNSLFQLIRQQGLAREFPLIVSTLKSFGKGEFSIDAGEVIDAHGKPIRGYNLTQEIEEKIMKERE